MKNLSLLFSFVFLLGFSLSAQLSDTISGLVVAPESPEEFVPTADILHNIFAKEKEGSADIIFFIDYDAIHKLEAAGYTVVI